ncbi:MAG: hypothetical protein B7Z23_04090 [Pseudomonadales bacterium 32-61-5]|nr:MAG: hypothetical protein B7Z23_04090 [Pseudomonadales bacterium 32-61-5]
MKTCKHCATPFTPQRPLQAVCSPRCAGRYVKAAKKAEAVQTRERKAALKRIPDLIREAQTAFNAFVRERDRDQPCICCGHPLGAQDASASTGGAFDCGHYRSTGSASHLRFDERNAHGQRKVCNRYGAGRAVDYRIGLIDRIGLDAVEALESDNTPRKWQRDELIAIKAEYVEKLKQLKKETA